MLANATGLPTSDHRENLQVDAPVYLAPVTVWGYPLWIVVTAASISVAVVFSILVGFICYYARKVKAKQKNENEELGFPRIATEISDITAERMTTSIESSEESTGTNNTKKKAKSRLRPSLSMDTEIPFYLTSQNVQPAMRVPKWSALHSPRPSIGALQPDTNRSSDSEDGGTGSALTDIGRLWFSLVYKKGDQTLLVSVLRANYLPGRGFCRGLRDPFVKIFLLPDEENFQQSRVKKRTLSPKFNETFTFKVGEDDVRNRCVRFTIYDVDKRKVRHCLGHAVLPLSKADLETDSIIWRDLEKSPEIRAEGELQVGLMCNPYSNKVKVSICKAQNVQGLDGGDALVYVKVQLYHGHKLVRSKRTATQSTVGPSKTELIFRETMSFAVPAKFYDSCYIQMTTCVSGGALAKDVALGKVTIGPFLFSRGEQLLHWQEMITNPRNSITKWHRLERVN